jgi:serine protease Do
MKVNELVRRPVAAALLGAATVAVPAGALYLYGAAPHAAETIAAPSALAAAAPAPAIGGAQQVLPDFRALVAATGPSVVNISVKGTVKTSEHVQQMPDIPGFGPDDPWHADPARRRTDAW